MSKKRTHLNNPDESTTDDKNNKTGMKIKGKTHESEIESIRNDDIYATQPYENEKEKNKSRFKRRKSD